MQITVLPPYWQTWWFRLSALAAVAALLVGLYRRKVSRLENEKRAQEKFSRQQIESEDLARKKLAAELHDGLAQDLLVASNEIQQFLREENGTKQDLVQAASLVQESIQAVREISTNLHPHHLERLGFISAVEAMTENLARTTGLVVHNSLYRIDGRFGKDKEIHLYRIVQEALTNVLRHARAKNVGVRITEERGAVQVVVVDDGQGFQPEEMAKHTGPTSLTQGISGFGLASMSERARIIGATLHIDSSPGSGTILRITLPIES